MAIDTAAKQMSMLNFGGGSNLTVLPIPDGAYDSADWQHLLGLYSGIAADAPAIVKRWFFLFKILRHRRSG